MPTEPQAAATIDALRARTEAQRCPDCGLGNDLNHAGCARPATTPEQFATRRARIDERIDSNDVARNRFETPAEPGRYLVIEKHSGETVGAMCCETLQEAALEISYSQTERDDVLIVDLDHENEEEAELCPVLEVTRILAPALGVDFRPTLHAATLANETNVLEVVETHLPATSTPPLPAAPIGPLSVQPLQWDHGASIAICHPERGVIATIEPTNSDDDPSMDTAKREPWDASYAFLFAAAPQMLAALANLEAAVRREELECVAYDTIGVMSDARAAIAAAAPVANPLIGQWWEGPAITGDDDVPPASGEDLTECQNCGKVQPERDLNEIKDFDQRVELGEAVPVGECPDCGSLCHPVAKAVLP